MPPVKVLHISDTHFGKHEDRKRDAVLSFADRWRPDVVAVTGDVLDWPLSWSSRSLDQAKVFLDALRGPDRWVVCIPGNHDALFGRLFLDRFWRKLQPRQSFVDYRKVRGQGVCIIGADSTHFSLRSANNTGHFDARRQAGLQLELARLGEQPDIDLGEAITLALVHHHPVPTTTSESERQLYFNNAGLFLSFAVRNGVRLILHGHQHDPNFVKISFGSGRDEDVIGVLSAGACTRADPGEPETSGCGHLFAITIDEQQAIVESCFYHRSEDRFIALEELKVPRTVSADPQLLTVDQVFSVTPAGDMHARETRRYRRTHARPCAVSFSIGVDDEDSPAVAGTAPLGLAATLDGTGTVPRLVRDEPHTKAISVDAGAGNRGQEFEVAIDYTWPYGFRRFLALGVDSGEFTILSKGVEWCRVELDVTRTGRSFADLKVFHAKRDAIEVAQPGPARRSFTITGPRASSRISWNARIGTPKPPDPAAPRRVR